MLRKTGLICALMLSIPTFANAWTLTAKIGSGAGQVSGAIGSVTKAATDSAKLAYLKTATNLGADLTQTVSVTPATGYSIGSVVVDGSIKKNTDGTPVSAWTFDNTATPSKSHSMVVYYIANGYSATLTTVTADAAKGSVYVRRFANGAPAGPYSRATLANLKPGAQVVYYAVPNADYSVAADGFFPAGNQGEAVVSAPITIASADVTNPAAPTFTLIPKVTARMYINKLMAKTGETLSLNATATTGNAAISYTFAATPSTGVTITQDGSANATAVFANAGVYQVSVTANDGASDTFTTQVTVNSPTDTAIAVCLNCHNNRNADLVAEFKTSGHYANSGGPECVKCHVNSADTTAHATVANGYNACIGCHNGGYDQNFGDVRHFTNMTTAAFHTISAAYVGYGTGTGHLGDYAGMKGKGINICANCHMGIDAHGIGAANVTTFQQNADILSTWAESGHGERSAAPWTPSASHDWRNTGTSKLNFQKNIPASDCLRCHTSAGFAQFVSSKFTNVSSVGAKDGQRWNSPLACFACHQPDGDGAATSARRAVALNKAGAYGNGKTYGVYPAPATNVGIGVTTFYNLSTVDKVTKLTVKARVQADFPDVGDSNICNTCHTARFSGAALVQAVNNGLSLSNSGFQNSHYMGASGMMYMKAGFTAFTSANAVIGTSTYGKTLTSSLDMNGGVTSTHRNLGTPAIVGDHGITAGTLDQNGPCVTCHMKGLNAAYPDRVGAGHSLQIDAEAFTQVCSKCHTSEAGTPLTTFADFQTYFLDPNSEVFQNALALAKQELLANYNITYNSASYPYFYDQSNSGKAVSDWTRATFMASKGLPALTTAQALKLEGACFNINLLSREPGAFAHSRTYTRRLVYDTIDFLDDGAMDLSVGATALASGMLATDGVTPIYSKAATAYTGGAPYAGGTLTSGTSESMTYIIGWTGTGAWATPERP